MSKDTKTPETPGDDPGVRFRARRPAGPAKGAGAEADSAAAHEQEIGGPEGPEPTRYGDWQFKGRVTDF